VEFHGHGGTVNDLKVLVEFGRAVFYEIPEINESFGNADVCPSRTEIKGNSWILNEITEKNRDFKLKNDDQLRYFT